jgi:hypothetical protein
MFPVTSNDDMHLRVLESRIVRISALNWLLLPIVVGGGWFYCACLSVHIAWGLVALLVWLWVQNNYMMFSTTWIFTEVFCLLEHRLQLYVICLFTCLSLRLGTPLNTPWEADFIFLLMVLDPTNSWTNTNVVPGKMLESFPSILDADYLPLMSFVTDTALLLQLHSWNMIFHINLSYLHLK